MKRLMIGGALLLFSLPSLAKNTITTEILIGHAQHKMEAYIKNEFGSEISEQSLLSSLSANTFAFRLGVKYSNNISFELSKHNHGKVVSHEKFTTPTGDVIVPDSLNATIPVYSDETVFTTNIPIELTSYRLGIKGEKELSPNISVNARIGLVNWKYDSYTPFNTFGISSRQQTNSGNDIFYSLGAEYKIIKDFYIGMEYSFFRINEEQVANNTVSGFDKVTRAYRHNTKDISVIFGWKF